MTAHAMAGDIEQSHAAGMNAHVTKPIDIEQLFTALVTWIQPRAGIGAAAPPVLAAVPALEEDGLPSELPGVDLADGLRRVGGNRRVYRDLLGRFGASFADTAVMARRLLAEGDADAAGRLVHNLKGVAGNLGAGRLHLAASAAEAAIRHGTDSERAGALDALAAPLRTVVDGLAHLAARRGLDPAGTAEIQTESISRLPAALRDQFRAAAIEADMDRLLELAAQVARSDAALAGGLRALVDGFAYERLVELMERQAGG